MDPDLRHLTNFYGTEILGTTRKDFHRRLAGDMRQVLQRGYMVENPVYVPLRLVLDLEEENIHDEEDVEMVEKVNVQQAVDRLQRCPVCGSDLKTFPDYPLDRSCVHGCGDLTITDVWLNGDVSFEFKMLAQKTENDVIDRSDSDERSTDQ